MKSPSFYYIGYPLYVVKHKIDKIKGFTIQRISKKGKNRKKIKKV